MRLRALQIRAERDAAAKHPDWAKNTQEFAERFRHFRHPTPWFHTIWYDAYDDPDIGQLYVQGPREHAKSSTVWTYALRRLCENHHLRVGIISGNDVLAIKFLNELKYELETNQALMDTYNGGRPFKGARWTEHELSLDDAHDGPQGISGKDVSIFAIGRGGQISSRHCDLLIADDVESAETVKSETVRLSTAQWWAREVMPVLSPGGKFIVVGTRKSHVDLYSRLMGDETWTTIKIAASVWKDDGEPIWPEMWDKAALLVRKATLDRSDVLAWSQEYLNKPLPSSTQMFHPESWPIYLDEPHSLGMRDDVSVIQFWDLAISEKTTADFTCGVCAAVDTQNNLYVLEVRRGHWDFNRTLQEIGSMGASYPKVTLIGIEKVAYQASAVQEATRRTMLPIKGVEVDKDKVTRARLVEARAQANKVHRPKVLHITEDETEVYVDPEWWADFATECSFFPDPGTHDDQVDGLSGVSRMAGWSADSVGYAYGVWTCLNCGHMFVWAAGRPCPKCATKAPDVFENPDVAQYGGRLLEDGTEDAELARVEDGGIPTQLVEAMAESGFSIDPAMASKLKPEPIAILPPVPGFPAGAKVYEIEVIPHGNDPSSMSGLRQTIEEMGSYLTERDGHFYVATLNPNYMRFALTHQGYVQSVI